jgi:glycosyltransferase involved in cell wall biosynthesis
MASLVLSVLTLTPSYPRFPGDYHGGFVHDLCLRLHQDGISLKVLAPRSRSSRPHLTPFPVKRYPYMPLRRLEFLSERTMKGAPAVNLVQLPSYLFSAYLHKTRENPSIIHAHLALPMGLVATLPPRPQPILITCHGSDCTLPYTNPKYRPFVELPLKKADKVIAVSKFIGRLALHLGAQKVEVIHMGVDTERFTPPPDKRRLREEMGLPPDRPVVGSLGRLVPQKRVGDIITAASTVSEETDALFLIGGEGPSRPRLEGMAGGSENILFLGEISDARRFHQLCDVFVLASVREGLSTALQEAMSTGVTPVTVNGFG